MFGIATAEDLYERIVMALVHLSDKDMRSQAAAKTMRGALNGISGALIKKNGIIRESLRRDTIRCLPNAQKEALSCIR